MALSKPCSGSQKWFFVFAVPVPWCFFFLYDMIEATSEGSRQIKVNAVVPTGPVLVRQIEANPIKWPCNGLKTKCPAQRAAALSAGKMLVAYCFDTLQLIAMPKTTSPFNPKTTPLEVK